MFKRLGVLVLAFLLSTAAFTVPAFGADGISIEDSLAEIVSHYENDKTTLDNWEEVVGLSRAGVDISSDTWQLPDWDIESLDATSYPADYAKTILGMLAANQDPKDADGRDIVVDLVGLQAENGTFGERINDTIWSIVALDTAGESYNVSGAVAYLLEQQTSDGGFALSGDTADPDITGFALIALAPHLDETGVPDAFDQVKECLHTMQLDSGGFSGGAENAESIAAVIRGLLACEEDIIAEDWNKNGNTMIDALYAFQLEDKSFAHIAGGNSNDMATRQSLIAVADMVQANVVYTIGAGNSDPAAEEANVRVRVEGAADELLDADVTLTGTALEALQAAAGEVNVTAPGGFVSDILGESGQTDAAEGIDTSWFYYVIRDGEIELNAFNEGPSTYIVEDGDEVIYYIGAYDNSDWTGKTYLPVVTFSPETPSAGQSLTISLAAKKYDWIAGLQDLTTDEAAAIGDYTVIADGREYTSTSGQVSIENVSEGTLEYSITNNNEGYSDVVTYKGTVEIGAELNIQVRVRVEGAADELLDEQVIVTGTALEALQAAAGEGNVDAPGGFVSEILGESGQINAAAGIDTSWFYYVIRDGAIELSAFDEGPGSYLVEDGDEVIYYIGAYNNTDWTGKTYLPVVTASPAMPSAGQSLTISLAAKKYDWIAGLQDLTNEEAAAIGDYTVSVDGREYTSTSGQVNIGNVSEGTLEYTVTNNNVGYADVVRYKGRVEVSASDEGPGVENYVTVKIAVVGKDGGLLYEPDSVLISEDDEFGLTVMSALDITGLSWSFSDSWDGMVVEIAGEENEGTNGWMYSINGSTAPDLPINVDVSNGDEIIFWYSMEAMADGPTWNDLSNLASGKELGLTAEEKEIKSILNNYRDELARWLGAGNSGLETFGLDRKMTQNTAQTLQKELAENKVDISQEVGGNEAVLANQEVYILVPENALNATLNLTIKELTSLPEIKQFTISVAGSIYEFGPSGTQFNEPVTIAFKVPITEDLKVEKLALAWYDESSQQWIPVSGIIDLETGLVIFQSDHFSMFAVINLPEPLVILPPRVSFSDVGDDITWAKDAIEILAGQGVIKGTGQGLFEPERSISRAEFVQLVANSLRLEKEEYKQGLFSDVNSSNWFAAAVAAAYKNKISVGYPDGTFGPNNSISRNEVAGIFYNMKGTTDGGNDFNLGYKDFDDIPVWALNAVKFANKQGLMNGYEDGTFQGNNPLTRAEAAVIIYNYLKPVANN